MCEPPARRSSTACTPLCQSSPTRSFTEVSALQGQRACVREKRESGPVAGGGRRPAAGGKRESGPVAGEEEACGGGKSGK
eukprot:352367-Chlamydomonas_euryale.AAC.6